MRFFRADQRDGFCFVVFRQSKCGSDDHSVFVLSGVAVLAVLIFRYGFVKNLIAYSAGAVEKRNCFHDQRFSEMTRRLYGAAGEISMN